MNNNWIENKYTPIVPNNKLKFFSSIDSKYSHNEKKLYDLFESLKHTRFQSWIQSPLYKKTIATNGKYKGKYIYDDEYDVILKKKFVQYFIYSFQDLLRKYGYSINNDKLFRDEVASFIYRLSK